MVPGSGPEKRKFPRVPLVLLVRFNAHGDGSQTAWTENLSAGGLFISTDQPFNLGEEILVHVSFPGLLAAMELRGRVAWVRDSNPLQPGGIGLEVTNEPARRRLADIALRAANPLPQNAVQPFRVLIVEDNPRVLRSFERVLDHVASVSGSAIETVMAQNGHEALLAVEQRGFDLIITDVYMPVMDGFTMIERLRRQEKTAAIPVIVTTGGHAMEKQRAVALGVEAFLPKPVQFGQLLQTIVCLATLRPSSGSSDAAEQIS